MIKLKSIIVILFSSLVISAALVITIIGSSLHLSWREKEAAKLHSRKISGLNAKLYGQHINIFDLQAKRGRISIYKEKFLIEGIIKNTGFRTVSSITLRADFLNAAHQAIHTEIFKPLGSTPLPSKTSLAALPIFVSGKELPLAPGQSMRFKHILSCQKDKNVVSPIKYKKYATNPNEWSGKFDYQIIMVKF